MQYLSKKVEDTEKIAKNFIKDFILSHQNRDKAFVVGLYGDLGAGKTTFMKYLAKNLGVEETIQSPTFVIMKSYSLKGASKKAQVKEKEPSNFQTFYFQTLYHIDSYRIEKDEEMLKLGWNEIISNPKNLVFVEWPEIIKDIMPPHTKIFFEHISQNERKIKIAQT